MVKRMLNGSDRRAFTLVELLVVIGLMGLLATISIGGYFAATRGMAARGAMQDTASLIRQAMQTCLIDQVPTAVLFVNRRLNDSEKEGEAYGTAIAVKMAGRISYIANNGTLVNGSGCGPILIDEFSDWNQSYSTDSAASGSKQNGFRLYRMFGSDSGYDALSKGWKNCSSLMGNYVGYYDFGSEFMVTAGIKLEDWCNENDKIASKNKSYSGTSYDNGNSYRWGLPFHPNNDGLSVSAWRIGDGYGVEIGSLDLPKSYIYGRTPPRGVAIEAAGSPSQGVLVFTPGKVTGANNADFSGVNEVEISVLNNVKGTGSGGITSIGKVDRTMLKDD